MVTAELIDTIVQRLLAETPPGTFVVLFGSQAKGTARADSDIDLMVVEPEVASPFEETLRLRKIIGSIPESRYIPIDLIATCLSSFEHWKDTPCTLAHEAITTGRRYDAA